MRNHVASLARLAADCSLVSEALDSKPATWALKDLANPPSVTGTVRKIGVALAVAPEPATTVAGVALVAASDGSEHRRPATLRTLRDKASDQLSELRTTRRELSHLSVEQKGSAKVRGVESFTVAPPNPRATVGAAGAQTQIGSPESDCVGSGTDCSRGNPV